MSQKVLLLGLDNIDNMGDEILVNSTEWIVKQLTNDIVFRYPLMPDINTMHWTYRLFSIIWRPFRSLCWRSKKYPLINLNFLIDYYRYYDNLIKKVDVIILPIGMLKFANQNFSYAFDQITQIANKYNKSVMFSGMSIAHPDKSDWRYCQLVKSINRSSVKMITTRDGQDGISLLKQNFLRREVYTDFVGDPALWIPELYGFSDRTNYLKNNVIGINLIRKGIYSDYKEQEFSDVELINLYKGVIRELSVRGYEWELFCNGMIEDYEVGLQLVKEMNLPVTKLITPPKNGRELVQIISRYRCVFGARLHACIISVAIGIPVAGLLWDKKLHYFSKTMKIRHLFSDGDDLQENIIVDRLESSVKEGLDYENRDFYKRRTLECFRLLLR